MKLTLVVVATAFLAMSLPAAAQDVEGTIQVKLLGTGVLADAKISEVRTDIVGLPADTQAEAKVNYVPTVASEHFLAEISGP